MVQTIYICTSCNLQIIIQINSFPPYVKLHLFLHPSHILFLHNKILIHQIIHLNKTCTSRPYLQAIFTSSNDKNNRLCIVSMMSSTVSLTSGLPSATSGGPLQHQVGLCDILFIQRLKKRNNFLSYAQQNWNKDKCIPKMITKVTSHLLFTCYIQSRCQYTRMILNLF